MANYSNFLLKKDWHLQAINLLLSFKGRLNVFVSGTSCLLSCSDIAMFWACSRDRIDVQKLEMTLFFVDSLTNQIRTNGRVETWPSFYQTTVVKLSWWTFSRLKCAVITQSLSQLNSLRRLFLPRVITESTFEIVCAVQFTQWMCHRLRRLWKIRGITKRRHIWLILATFIVLIIHIINLVFIIPPLWPTRGGAIFLVPLLLLSFTSYSLAGLSGFTQHCKVLKSVHWLRI